MAIGSLLRFENNFRHYQVQPSAGKRASVNLRYVLLHPDLSPEVELFQKKKGLLQTE
jgi:hypothetical protein